jgi:hypothetical protein
MVGYGYQREGLNQLTIYWLSSYRHNKEIG